MKRILFLLIAIIAWAAVSAQTIQIFKDGELVASYDETNMDEVTFSAQSVTVMSASSTVVYDEKDIDEIQYKADPLNYPFVDLGLSVAWAAYDVGAHEIGEEGERYAWGETTPKSEYTQENYKWFDYHVPAHYDNGNWIPPLVYYKKNHIDPQDDVAHVKWGGDWRMPTEEEVEELREKCRCQLITFNGKPAYLVTGPNGATAIFPDGAGSWWCNGYWEGGGYWGNFSELSYFMGKDKIYSSSTHDRYEGLFVRPVMPGGQDDPYLKVDQDEIFIGSATEIHVESNTFWTAECSADWVTLSEKSSVGNKKLRITTTQNNSTSLRDAILTISHGNIKKRIYIYQKGNKQTANNKYHSYVNLGLSVVWGATNLGANKPSEGGDYYAWGETKPKRSNTWDSYKFGTSYKDFYKYNEQDKKKILDQFDDAAKAVWEGNWRMPLYTEWNELCNSCTWDWDEEKQCAIVTGPNGNFILLPAVGYCYNSEEPHLVGNGYYWSNQTGDGYDAFCLTFRHNSQNKQRPISFGDYELTRVFALSVRPICDFVRDEDDTHGHSSILLATTPDSLIFESSESRDRLIVRANFAWTATTNASWITISPSEGDWVTEVSVEVEKNNSLEERTDTITFQNGVFTRKVLVRQKGASVTLKVDQTELKFSSTSSSKPIAITSNNSWSAACTESWVTLNKTEGSGDETIEVTVTANENAAARTATITFSSGDITRKVSITQGGKDTSATGSANGHSYVDLGLPSGALWATCNVGAEVPEDYGDYYAWGETETKDYYYDWDTYKDRNESSFFKYREGCKSQLASEDDVAHVKWGDNWHIPSKEDFEELLAQCAWTWMEQNGVPGNKVTGPNGNYIFLPFTGVFSKSLINTSFVGVYTVNSLYPEKDNYAYSFTITQDKRILESTLRYYGHTVRPVYSDQEKQKDKNTEVDVEGEDFDKDEDWNQKDPDPDKNTDVDGEDFDEDEDWNQPDPEPTEEVDVEGGDYDEDEDWDE